jgi:hypothetical protein
MAQLALALLGPLQATLNGVPITGFESQKVRALLVYLAIEADSLHTRDALAGLLWPDQPDQDARANLRQTLSNLRLTLGDQQATPPYVRISGATIQFNRASDQQIDVAAFTALLAACDGHPHRHPERFHYMRVPGVRQTGMVYVPRVPNVVSAVCACAAGSVAKRAA